MKCLLTGLTVAVTLLTTGCNQGTPGGPGATNVTANKPITGQG